MSDYQIIDFEKLDNVLTIVLYDHYDLAKIKNSCMPLAKNNEYQCHYFALVRTEKNSRASLNIVIPLVYYNYKQRVTSVTIDFNMEDVTEQAKMLEETARLQAKRVKLLLKDVEAIMPNCESIEYKLTYYNNIHKHP